MNADYTISEMIKYACEGVTSEERAAAILLADNSAKLLDSLQGIIQKGWETDSQGRLVIRLEEEEVSEVWELIKKVKKL